MHGVLAALGIPPSRWYYRPTQSEIDGRRRDKVVIPAGVEDVVLKTAKDNPWYGYKRIAVLCRRAKQVVTDRQAYVVMRRAGLLQERRRVRTAEAHPGVRQS